MSTSLGCVLVPVSRAEDLAARATLLPSRKRIVAGAVDVAISSPVTSGHEDTPGAEMERPASVTGSVLDTVATGAEPKLANGKAASAVNRIVMRFIENLHEFVAALGLFSHDLPYLRLRIVTTLV
jgi:hypothetical protein